MTIIRQLWSAIVLIAISIGTVRAATNPDTFAPKLWPPINSLALGQWFLMAPISGWPMDLM